MTALQAHQTVNFNGIPYIIISEFRFRGPNGATDEFVELYNQTDQPIDITGWALVSLGTILHTASGSIPARSHYLITGAIQRNGVIKTMLVDAHCAGFGTATSGCARVRTAAGANSDDRAVRDAAHPPQVHQQHLRERDGATLPYRRHLDTGQPRRGSGQADLRVISSSPSDFNVTLTSGMEAPIKGTQVETSPAQPNGGGLNSTVTTITTATPILPFDWINVEFTLGVQQEGAFSFIVNIEALTAPHPTVGAMKVGATKRAASRKEK